MHMDQKRKIQMIAGLWVGSLIASIGGIYLAEQTWASLFGSITGMVVASVILWKVWTPPSPAEIQQLRRGRWWVIGLMLIAAVVLVLIPRVPHFAPLLYVVTGVTLLAAFLILYRNAADGKKTQAWLFLAGVAILMGLVSLTAIAPLILR